MVRMSKPLACRGDISGLCALHGIDHPVRCMRIRKEYSKERPSVSLIKSRSLLPALIVSILSIALPSHAVAQERPALIDVIEGNWELDPRETENRGDYTCDQKPMRIEISEDQKIYSSTVAGSTRSAMILDATAHYILIEYLEEERLDADGQPVQWYLHMTDTDHFFWIRVDWLGDGEPPRTAMRQRCPNGPLIG